MSIKQWSRIRVKAPSSRRILKVEVLNGEWVLSRSWSLGMASSSQMDPNKMQRMETYQALRWRARRLSQYRTCRDRGNLQLPMESWGWMTRNQATEQETAITVRCLMTCPRFKWITMINLSMNSWMKEANSCWIRVMQSTALLVDHSTITFPLGQWAAMWFKAKAGQSGSLASA